MREGGTAQTRNNIVYSEDAFTIINNHKYFPTHKCRICDIFFCDIFFLWQFFSMTLETILWTSGPVIPMLDSHSVGSFRDCHKELSTNSSNQLSSPKANCQNFDKSDICDICNNSVNSSTVPGFMWSNRLLNRPSLSWVVAFESIHLSASTSFKWIKHFAPTMCHNINYIALICL